MSFSFLLISTKRIWCPSSLNFFKRLKKKEHSQRHSMKLHHPHSKTRQRYHQKRKLLANIFDEYRCKNSQQNFSQLNPTTYKKDHTPQPGGIHPRCTRMVQHTQINVIHHINKRKVKNHVIISMDAEKAFDKIQHPVMIKTLTKVGLEGTYLNWRKDIYDKPKDNSYSTGKGENISCKFGKRQRCPSRHCYLI